MVRTPCCDKSGLKKGTWTPEEDRKLMDYVTRYGCWNWRQLPKYAGLSRCGKSCRLRWMNYLRPNIKRGNYSKEEEDIIIRLHQQLGNRWSTIAAELPGRTDNEIKNHWHTNLKKRLLLQNSVTDDQKSDQNSQSETSSQEEVSKPPQEFDINPMNTPQILESSTSTSSSTDHDQVSSITIDTTPVEFNRSSETIIQEDSVANFFEPYAGNNFWTEPFLADNSYNFNISNDFLAPLIDHGYVSLHSPFLDGELLCPYGLY
ncbi:hypothetical protein EZV62_020537 [Acer yangbiense]|uniref:Uncharacterized protein n=1 Tax=Acer yangbiense TaxID=1000413 RepID=A0A5C7HED3_9ROSI|nr:hypothetical protein EZV62_020537 [Acer yangbiense]